MSEVITAPLSRAWSSYARFVSRNQEVVQQMENMFRFGAMFAVPTSSLMHLEGAYTIGNAVSAVNATAAAYAAGNVEASATADVTVLRPTLPGAADGDDGALTEAAEGVVGIVASPTTTMLMSNAARRSFWADQVAQWVNLVKCFLELYVRSRVATKSTAPVASTSATASHRRPHNNKVAATPPPLFPHVTASLENNRVVLLALILELIRLAATLIRDRGWYGRQWRRLRQLRLKLDRPSSASSRRDAASPSLGGGPTNVFGGGTALVVIPIVDVPLDGSDDDAEGDGVSEGVKGPPGEPETASSRAVHRAAWQSTWMVTASQLLSAFRPVLWLMACAAMHKRLRRLLTQTMRDDALAAAAARDALRECHRVNVRAMWWLWAAFLAYDAASWGLAFLGDQQHVEMVTLHGDCSRDLEGEPAASPPSLSAASAEGPLNGANRYGDDNRNDDEALYMRGVDQSAAAGLTETQLIVADRANAIYYNGLRDPIFASLVRERIRRWFVEGGLARVPLIGAVVSGSVEYALLMQQESFLFTVR